MQIKYKLLADEDVDNWKIYDTVEVLKLNYRFILKSQEEFDNTELARFKNLKKQGCLEYEVVE